MPRAGTLRNLFVRHNSASPGATTVTYTVFVNNAATALTVPLMSATVVSPTPGGSSDTNPLHNVAVAQGADVAIQATTGGGGAAGVDSMVTLELA
jgi:hypothetical protein